MQHEKCKVKHCDKESYSAKLCRYHYQIELHKGITRRQEDDD